MCLLMRIIASFLCYTGSLSFINEPINQVFIAISSSYTTTDVYTYDITVSKRNGKHLCWSIKHSGEILINSSLMVF